jgi:hypothetical protein
MRPGDRRHSEREGDAQQRCRYQRPAKSRKATLRLVVCSRDVQRDYAHRLRDQASGCELERLQEQLRKLTVTPEVTADLAQMREQRAQLTSLIDQTEKALEEADRLLRSPSRSPVAAAG